MSGGPEGGGTDRVIDARLVGAGVGQTHDGLVGVHRQSNHHLDQHGEKQVPMDPRPVVLQLPVGAGQARPCRYLIVMQAIAFKHIWYGRPWLPHSSHITKYAYM